MLKFGFEELNDLLDNEFVIKRSNLTCFEAAIRLEGLFAIRSKGSAPVEARHEFALQLCFHSARLKIDIVAEIFL